MLDDIMAKINQVLLGIGIAIILALFVGYGIHSFYPSPKWEDFCNESMYTAKMPSPERATTKQECLDAGGKWNSYEAPDKNGTVETSGYCDQYYTCQKDFEAASEPYNKIVFIVTLILGISAVLAGGLFLKKVLSVSSGVMGGGILTIIYGTIRYWGNMPDKLRFIVLGLVLGILIWISYKTYKR